MNPSVTRPSFISLSRRLLGHKKAKSKLKTCFLTKKYQITIFSFFFSLIIQQRRDIIRVSHFILLTQREPSLIIYYFFVHFINTKSKLCSSAQVSFQDPRPNHRKIRDDVI